MPLNLLADILNLLGEILIAFAIIRVHTRLMKEHRIDDDVIRTIKGEQRYVIIGIIFLILSFILRFMA